MKEGEILYLQYVPGDHCSRICSQCVCQLVSGSLSHTNTGVTINNMSDEGVVGVVNIAHVAAGAQLHS